ncbi:MAG: UDP-diphosphatase [Bacteroidetes bacterium CG02_land_8_20_14_3_00_31_25]|nr:undecaprenyl-diphosphate phosphatase [Bacteroidota bacterium]PIV59378.1 MAG: UDP-diphosphatase [Bacteroidetes bacterium CG02_land_8_20_14_3_00_31_25]PIX32958.1 MAG: UDP-diphosphatase [Bacteroidetes bacterium CG_4_8_14_3_um_filter_31_14]PIY02235.1 MAG: UDP-diphosphatase [Bacteroidetes bacterium CG_4_10_14_3_um_filter_31_20]
MSWLEVIILSIIEGLTEFLPISSTGHMIIAQSVLGMENTDFLKAFLINIQFGAILSVIVLYWKRFFQTVNFYYKLFVAFLPAAIIGFLLGDYIDMLLENVLVVAVSLLLGGIVLVFIDKWLNKPSNKQEITYNKALKIGIFQCIAMIPGVSRSAATIIGGMTQKLNRKTAAEFSFFLAVPTMFAASAYKLLKNEHTITSDNVLMLIGGNIVAFIVALIAIKSFITFLTKYGFKVFGWYRIVLGLVILILLALGYNLSIL